MTSLDRCVVCDGADLRPITEIAATPVFSNVLFPTRDAAQAAEVGDINLAVCERCSHLQNVTFDEQRLAYSPDYENSLHFSPTFQAYATELARALVTEYDLRGRQVVELGCGKGDFLALLADAGDTESVGFDPSYAGAVDAYHGRGSVRVVADTYEVAGGDLAPALVASRHVLEHLTTPGNLLRGLRLWADHDPAVYLEVPNADYMLEATAIWDVIYEHPSYFTHASLRRLCEEHGLCAHRIEASFGEQYLTAHARVRAGESVDVRDPANPDGFARAIDDLRSDWAERLATARESDVPVAIWGAGSKGASFLTMVEGASDSVHFAVDLNPRKHGQFLPVSGIEVIGPDDERLRDVGLVVVMNPTYTAEITSDLDERGIPAEIATV